MKTQLLSNPFPWKETIFRCGSREILLKELPIVNFLAAIGMLFNDDVSGFFDLLNISEEERLLITSSEEIFKGFLKTFLTVHKDTLNEGKKEAGEVSAEEFFNISTGIIKVFCSVYYSHPVMAGNNYSLRQMILWLKDDEKEQSQGKSRGDGKIPYLPVPSNARNFKEWTDGAGNRCRRWEIEV